MDVFARPKVECKSSFLAVVIALASAVVFGCSSSPIAENTSVEQFNSVSVGQRYVISTGSESRGKKFTGQMTQVHEDSIVMADPHLEIELQQTWPIVGAIPGRNRRGVARVQRVGDVTIDRGDIVAIESANEGAEK